MEGEAGRIVARLDAASQVRQGEDSELWVDATHLQLFDPSDGRNLTVSQDGPAATTDGGRFDRESDIAGEDPNARREGDEGEQQGGPAAGRSEPGLGS
jgi:hypothetical protein